MRGFHGERDGSRLRNAGAPGIRSLHFGCLQDAARRVLSTSGRYSRSRLIGQIHRATARGPATGSADRGDRGVLGPNGSSESRMGRASHWSKSGAVWPARDSLCLPNLRYVSLSQRCHRGFDRRRCRVDSGGRAAAWDLDHGGPSQFASKAPRGRSDGWPGKALPSLGNRPKPQRAEPDPGEFAADRRHARGRAGGRNGAAYRHRICRGSQAVAATFRRQRESSRLEATSVGWRASLKVGLVLHLARRTQLDMSGF